MYCVNLLGQGRPDSQIQLATSWVPVSFLLNMECVNPLVQDRPQIHWLQHGWLSPSNQIWNALTFLARVGLLAKYNCLQPLLSPSLSNMECVNHLGQGRPDCQTPQATARVAVSFYQIWNASTFLGREGRLAKCNWRPPGSLSPSDQIWNALTFLARVGRLAKYHWLQPGACLLPIKYGMR
ncbi:hypothetical protein CEXT_147751 [Caerostris extrusa]|uniref:Uncharacterized protein n=1 Tax=Caerostris extrusa TaxID=172846 RepID=A0AAV4PDR3_CAEEX|nr:hypothetical protein CEXT_147751 [Caerostris extrusa]